MENITRSRDVHSNAISQLMEFRLSGEVLDMTTNKSIKFYDLVMSLPSGSVNGTSLGISIFVCQYFFFIPNVIFVVVISATCCTLFLNTFTGLSNLITGKHRVWCQHSSRFSGTTMNALGSVISRATTCNKFQNFCLHCLMRRSNTGSVMRRTVGLSQCKSLETTLSITVLLLKWSQTFLKYKVIQRNYPLYYHSSYYMNVCRMSLV